MAETYKVLGQSSPSATTATTLYTCPSATQTVISTISVCNRGTSSGTYRISTRPGGAAQANQHYFVFDSAIEPKDTIFLSVGLTLSASDVITVYTSTGDFSFNAYGSEIS